MDRAAPSVWDEPGTVEGFVRSPPNQRLIDYATGLYARTGALRVLDIGCGAGRNAVPLALAGCSVVGTDLSLPMLEAAARRIGNASAQLLPAAMDAIPVGDRSIDLIVAHGIWNLARSGAEFRRALGEAARVAAPGARLFLFTFSRHTLPADVTPVPGEAFVFTQFSGEPQVFLTDQQIQRELGDAGFDADPDLPLVEHNLPPPGRLRTSGRPVIYEGGFRFVKDRHDDPRFDPTR